MSYPKEILIGISWSFGFGAFEDEDDFHDTFQDYNGKINEGEDVDYDETVLESEKVVIIYESFNEAEDDFDDLEAVLEADNGESFSLSELMYKLNEEVSPNIEEDDRRFFEGLFFEADDDPTHPGTPIYLLNLGS